MNINIDNIKRFTGDDHEKNLEKLEKNQSKLWDIIGKFIKPLISELKFKRLKAGFYILFPPKHIPKHVIDEAKTGCITSREIVLLVMLLIYILTPADMIPDVIPLAGWFDDVAAVGFIMKIIGNSIDCFIREIESRGYVI